MQSHIHCCRSQTLVSTFTAAARPLSPFRSHLRRDKHLLEAHNVGVGQQPMVDDLPLHILLVEALRSGQRRQRDALPGGPGRSYGLLTPNRYPCATQMQRHSVRTEPSSMNFTATSSPVCLLRACCTQPKAPAAAMSRGPVAGRQRAEAGDCCDGTQWPAAQTASTHDASAASATPLSRSRIFSYLQSRPWQ